MTGWYPHVRGHRTLWHLLRGRTSRTCSSILKRAGYDVRWWGKNDLLSTAGFADSVSSESRAACSGATCTAWTTRATTLLPLRTVRRAAGGARRLRQRHGRH
ncbi:MAG: hypothetical protein R3A10_05440 [Caldilineaceae bacterium]